MPAKQRKPSSQPETAESGWKVINFNDIPDRPELIRLTLALLRDGVSNSDQMRDAIRRQRKLIMSKVTGNWNENPSSKFVNEHAWALMHLVDQGKIEPVAAKEYRLRRR